MADDELEQQQEQPEQQEGLQSPIDSEGFFLRVRGLPWTATKDDILKFFHDSNIVNDADGIHMTMSRGGRPSGECYIEFISEEDLNTAFKKHKHNMGHRYVEIFKSERSEMEWVCRKNYPSNDANATGFVWLRGIPFGCSKEEIAQFFAGLKIVPNGITLPVDETGRSTGEAFVQFASKEIAEKAMGKHKEKIGHRYIEIFQSSLQEVRNATQKANPRMRSMMGGGRPGPYSRNDRFGDMGGRFGGGMGGRSRNLKSFYDDDMYNDYGSGDDGYGGGRFGGGRPGGMGGPNRAGGFGGRGQRNDFGGGMDDMQGPAHVVHMRGLPFRATEQDVADFFKPIPISEIFVKYGNDGRAAGTADVAFYSHKDATKAMAKDKQNMHHRYVELFLESDPDDMDGNDGGNQGVGMADDYGMDNSGGGSGGGFGGFQGTRRMMQQNDYDDGNQFSGDNDGYGMMGGGNNGYRSSGNSFGGNNSVYSGATRRMNMGTGDGTSMGGGSMGGNMGGGGMGGGSGGFDRGYRTAANQGGYTEF